MSKRRGWDARYAKSSKGRRRMTVYRSTKSGRLMRRLQDYQRRARKYECADDLTRQDMVGVYDRWNGCCAYCGQRVPDTFFDHVVPLKRGGPNTAANLVPACADCNREKHNKNIFDMIEFAFTDGDKRVLDGVLTYCKQHSKNALVLSFLENLRIEATEEVPF